MFQSRRPFVLTIVLFALTAGSGCSRDPVDEILSLQQAGRYQKSLDPLEEILKARPDDPELQYLFGVANLRTGRPSLALWPLRKARENSDWAVRAGEALAEAALAADDNETAIEAATRVLEAQADHPEMLNIRAQAQLGANRFEAALADVDRLLELDPDDDSARLLRLQCLIALKRLDDAEALFDELEARTKAVDFPGVLAERYCAARAIFAKEKDDLDLAEQRFDQCLKEFPSSSVVIHEAIAFFDRRQRPERSTEILRAALELEPSKANVRETLAGRLRDTGQIKEAEALLLAGTKLEPALAYEAWGGLASHYFHIGDYAASVSAWEQVLQLVDEPGPEDLFTFAEVLVRAGRFDRAFEVAGKLPEAYAEIIRGLALLEQKQPAPALEHFAAGLRLWPNHSVARYYAAIAAERTGDFDRAVAEYRQSLRSGAADTDAGLRLAELHEAEGAYERAFQAITMHVGAHPGEALGRLAALRISARRGERKPVLAISLPKEQRAAFAAKAAEIVAQDGGPAAAIDFLRKAPGIDLTAPADAEALRALVIQLFAADKRREAHAQVEKALAAHPDVASFHAIRALELERGGAPVAEARAEYARALELDANCAAALAALGRLDDEEGNRESARSFYARAAAADPGDFESRRRAAELAVAVGDLDDAQRRFEALIEERPYDGESAAGLAALLLERGSDPERARSLARQAVRFQGGAPAYQLLVRSHLDAGEAERAVEALSAAAEHRPDDASLRYQLGRALAAAGKRDAAREAFEKALAAAGDFPERQAAATALAALPAKADGG